MKATYSLLARIDQKFHTIEIPKKGRPEPPKVPATFYARYSENGKRIYKKLGKDFDTAWKEIGALSARQFLNSRDIAVPAAISRGAQTFDERVEEYLKEVKVLQARKTWLAYQNSIRHFRLSCNAAQVQDVSCKDMVEFRTYMQEKANLSPRSEYNNFLNMMIFLKWTGVLATMDPQITDKYWPEKPPAKPTEYTVEEIMALLNEADSDERIVINSFLCTGLRSGELAHLTYGDIDFVDSIWTIQAKLVRRKASTKNWKPKTQESERDITVVRWLTAKIERRMKAINARREDLIFPAPEGGVDGHLLRIVKRVAKRAGLQGRFIDHKFRSTFITQLLNDGKSVPTVMQLVGHTKPETLMHYAAKRRLRNPEVHHELTRSFNRFDGVGGD